MKRLLTRQLFWLVPLIFGISLFLGWLDVRAEQIALSPKGGEDPFFANFFSNIADVILSFVSFFTCIVGCLLVIFRQTRTAGIFVALCAFAYLGGCESRHVVFGNPRKESFMQLGERMMPLVNAIETYHRDHGVYPKDLNALVPTYLGKLPTTGMGNYTNYNYYVGETARSYQGNPWIIDIPAGFGMGFDQFYYFPLQNYPGWPYERLGKWAYFHE